MSDLEINLLCGIAVAISSAWMAGVSMLVGTLNYPNFASISAERWQEFHQNHCQKIGKVVIVPMLIQLVSTIGLLLNVKLAGNELILFLNSIAFLGSSGLTFAVSGPLHLKISHNFSENLLNKLIVSNHIRTIFWMFNSFIASWFVFGNMQLSISKQ